MLGKTEGRRRATEEEMLDGITDTRDVNLGKLQKVRDREAWVAAVRGAEKSWTQLGD